MDVRIIVDAPAEGSWNMAVDQALLESVDAGDRPAIRIYGWRSPTLSLGYFQRSSDRAAHAPSREIAGVRRATGGGAIVHDRELTYSVAMPVENRAARHVSRLYCQIHHAMIEFLALGGVTARRFGDAPAEPPAAGAEAFLCFQRRTSDDLVVGDAKIAGSAQRRGRRSVLQHGSLLLAASPSAPELPGVAELTGRTIPADAAAAGELARIMARRLELRPVETELEASARDAAARIAAQRFSNDRWHHRR